MSELVGQHVDPFTSPGTNQPVPTRWPTARKAWLVTMTAALVVTITCGFLTADRARDLTAGPAFSVPGGTTVDLSNGHFILYELSGSAGSTSFGPDNVDITGPDERHPAPRDVTGVETINRGGDVYTGAAEFTAAVGGSYTITVRGSRRGTVLIARPISDTFARVAVWAVPAVLSGLLALAALIIVLVNPWGRSRSTAPGGPGAWPPPAASPPPGWYADPWRIAAQRWWDGATWTGYTSQEPPRP